MIKNFKFFTFQKKISLALIEFGDSEIGLDLILKGLEDHEIELKNTSELEAALQSGVYTTLEISDEEKKDFPGACWIDVDDEEGIAHAYFYPPTGAGRHITENDVLQSLESSPASEFYILNDILRRNIVSCKSSLKSCNFKVAERRDADISVEVPSDSKAAFITFHRSWGGTRIGFKDVISILSENEVVFGIDEEKIKNILENNRDVNEHQIASAVDPVEGTDATLEYLFDAFQKKAGPVIREDDTADFRDLNLFENVEEGAPLVALTPSTPGTDGTDVTGKPITTTPGKEITLPQGTNTKISEKDENLLVAACSGAPKLAHNKVIVEDVFVVTDVDFSTGNIDFDGNVVVKGIVNSGFSIKASGDITCNDTVEGADLSAGGSIFLKYGIKGLGKSVIEAGGDIIARFIERCTVNAGGSVIVDEALIHSDTKATDTVTATNKKGCIFGGHVSVGQLVKASFIGSEMAVKTNIEVGVTPHLRQELEDLNTNIRKTKEDYLKTDKNLVALTRMRENGGLPPEREKLYETLTVMVPQLKDDIKEMAERIEAIHEELKECADGRVEATETVYPGVSIAIKTAKRKIRESIDKAIFLKEGPDVVLAADLAEREESQEQKK